MRRVERGIYVGMGKNGRKRYYVRVTVAYQDTYRVAGSTITAARQLLRDLQTDAGRGEFAVHKQRRAPFFEDFADTYLEHARQNKRSWRRDDLVLRQAAPFFSPKRIDQVTSWDVERYKARRREEVEPATVNRDLAVLKRLFNLAQSWGFKLDNPVEGVEFFKVPERPMRVLTEDEELALYRAASPHLRPLIVVALNTGLRRGELLDLEWPAVDMHAKIITVKQSKSGRVRHVPMNNLVWEILHGVPGSHDRGHVFRYGGQPISDIKTAFTAAVRRCGIPRCTFHDLRHTFATRLVLAGVDLPTVKELMGHASITTTMRYAHPGPEHKRSAVSRLLLAQAVRVKSVQSEDEGDDETP